MLDVVAEAADRAKGAERVGALGLDKRRPATGSPIRHGIVRGDSRVLLKVHSKSTLIDVRIANASTRQAALPASKSVKVPS